MKELIEKAERIAAMGTRGPLGSGFADDGEGKLIWSDGLAGQRVATCATKADAEKFVAAVELLPALAAELRRLTELRPIAEAPRDGTWVILCWIGPGPIGLWEPGSPQKRLARWVDDDWRGYKNEGPYDLATHFLPLPDRMPR